MRRPSTFKISAPGSLMLSGEHAVLQGELALVAAVDARIHLHWAARGDRQIHIQSALAEYQGSLDALPPEPALSFVLAALTARLSELPCGLDLQIASEFSHEQGLGSSAAVVAAMQLGLQVFLGEEIALDRAFEQGLKTIHQVQAGRGSGSDLAASLYGGLVAYRMQPRQIERLAGQIPLSLVFSGYKMKTPDVLRWVEKRWQTQPELLAALYRLMGQTSEAMAEALRQEDWITLGQLMNTYQGLMDALGVNDATLSEIIYRARALPAILGAKISGSGLGDCVLLLGELAPQALAPYSQLSVRVSPRGTEVGEVDASA